MNKSIKKIVLMSLLAGLTVLAAGCDKNITLVDGRNGISISQFSASTDAPVALKQSITFTFKISDEDGEFDHLEITDSWGFTSKQTAASGSVSVVPTATADYQMSVYAKGENAARTTSSPIHIEVYDPNDPNTMIYEPSVEENDTNKNCADKIDSDYDGLIDCDDPGCSADAECIDKYGIKYTITPTPDASICHTCEGAVENCSCVYSSSLGGDRPIYNLGQTVTVAWEATGCTSVTILNDKGNYQWWQPSSGSMDLTLDAEKSVTFYGLDANDVKKSEETVSFTGDNAPYSAPVSEPETYQGSFRTTISSDSIIKGQSVTYTWTISSEYTDADLTYLGTTPPITTANGSLEITPDQYGDEDSITFLFSIKDAQGISSPIDRKTVKINSFKKCSTCTELGSVQKVVAGLDGYDYVLTNDNKIYKTADGGKTFGSPKSYSETILAFSVDTDSQIYTATDSGIFRDGNKIASCCGDTQQVQAIYAKDSNLVLVGTNLFLYQMKPKSGSCDSNWWVDEDSCVYYGTIAGRSGISGWVSNGGYSLSIAKFIPDLSKNGSTVMAITEAGAYISDNAGSSFATSDISNDPYPTSGYLGSYSSYIWNKDAVYPFVGNSVGSAWALSSSMESDEDVTAATSVGDLKILTTSKDIYYMLLNENSSWIECGAGKHVVGLIGLESNDVMSVRAVLSTGEIYQLSSGYEMLTAPVQQVGQIVID